jgi:hypothetical protein
MHRVKEHTLRPFFENGIKQAGFLAATYCKTCAHWFDKNEKQQQRNFFFGKRGGGCKHSWAAATGYLLGTEKAAAVARVLPRGLRYQWRFVGVLWQQHTLAPLEAPLCVEDGIIIDPKQPLTLEYFHWLCRHPIKFHIRIPESFNLYICGYKFKPCDSTFFNLNIFLICSLH